MDLSLFSSVCTGHFCFIFQSYLMEGEVADVEAEHCDEEDENRS